MKKTTALFLALLMLLSLVSCGGSGGGGKLEGVPVGEEFSSGDETYVVSHWERKTELDSDTETGYSLVLLSTATGMPVSFGMGDMQNIKFLLHMNVIVDGEEIGMKSFSAVENDPGSELAGRFAFDFAVPTEAGLPLQARFINDSDESSVLLNLEGAELK